VLSFCSMPLGLPRILPTGVPSAETQRGAQFIGWDRFALEFEVQVQSSRCFASFGPPSIPQILGSGPECSYGVLGTCKTGPPRASPVSRHWLSGIKREIAQRDQHSCSGTCLADMQSSIFVPRGRERAAAPNHPEPSRELGVDASRGARGVAVSRVCGGGPGGE
jgi:hypothetical protein